jgi:hypothetical protein
MDGFQEIIDWIESMGPPILRPEAATEAGK